MNNLMLRLVLFGLFAAVASLMFLHPDSAKGYVEERYEGVRKLLLRHFLIELPRRVIAELPLDVIRILAVFVLFGGIASALQKRVLICFYAFLVLAFGIFLHLPYKYEGALVQIRKSIFALAIFFSMIALCASSTNTQNKRAGDKEKHKQE